MSLSGVPSPSASNVLTISSILSWSTHMNLLAMSVAQLHLPLSEITSSLPCFCTASRIMRSSWLLSAPTERLRTLSIGFPSRAIIFKSGKNMPSSRFVFGLRKSYLLDTKR